MASKYVAEQHANLHIHRRGDGQTKEIILPSVHCEISIVPKGLTVKKSFTQSRNTHDARCSKAKERRKQTADNPNQRLSQYPAWRKSYALFFYATKTETMKFSMLAIAATALSAGVEGFSASRNFAVRKVSSMFLDDM